MEPFKNRISPALVRAFGRQLRLHAPRADAAGFEEAALAGLNTLELKVRVDRVAAGLAAALPGPAAARHRVLAAMLHPEADGGYEAESGEDGITGWGIWPLTEAVGRYGLDDFDGGLALLREATKRSTAEFAVRHFLLADQERALAAMAGWVEDPHPAVRRLVSEGTRPRLPWAPRLPRLVADPLPVLPLLERLRDDASASVRRSVANHLNDVAKDHPARVVEIAEAWRAGASAEGSALIRHACRSLVKAGDPRALAVLGYGPPAVEVGPLELSAGAVEIGGSLGIAATLRSTGAAPQRLIVDYVLHLLRADGTLSARVWTGRELTLAPRETARVELHHRFRVVTTRTLRPGPQAVRLRVNGVDGAEVAFRLLPAGG